MSIKKIFKEYVLTFAVAIVISLGIREAIAQPFVIPSGSMLPTIQIGDRILANKFIYRLRKPARGDIVVFQPPPDLGSTPFVKRLVGLPGDEIEVKNGQLYVNGKVFQKGFIGKVSYSYGPTRVPAGTIFLLGDNRDNSFDSHVWGFLPVGNVIGEGFLVYWPPQNIKLLK